MRSSLGAVLASLLLSSCGGGSAGQPVSHPAPDVGDLVISEVMANPIDTGNDASREWFEVYNASSKTLDLGGLEVSVPSNNKPPFVVPAGVIMPPGAYFIFADSADPTVNGGLPRVDVAFGASVQLVNASLTLTISLGSTLLDSVSFATIPNGSSLFLVALDPVSNDTLSNWCVSSTSYGAGGAGSPGAAATDSCVPAPM